MFGGHSTELSRGEGLLSCAQDGFGTRGSERNSESDKKVVIPPIFLGKP
jgi:hypothetical protein